MIMLLHFKVRRMQHLSRAVWPCWHSPSSLPVWQRLGDRGDPLPGSAPPAATTLPWERVCVRDMAPGQNWWCEADGYSRVLLVVTQWLVGLICQCGDRDALSRTVSVPSGPGLRSAPVGAFTFLPSDTPGLFARQTQRCPCGMRVAAGSGLVLPLVALGYRHPPAGDGQLIAPFPRS